MPLPATYMPRRQRQTCPHSCRSLALAAFIALSGPLLPLDLIAQERADSVQEYLWAHTNGQFQCMSVTKDPQFRSGLPTGDELSTHLSSIRADTIGMLLCGSLWVGMSQDLVRLSLGDPAASIAGTNLGTTEWHYQAISYSIGTVDVTLREGRVTAFHTGVPPAMLRLAQERVAAVRRQREDSLLRAITDSLRELAHDAADCRPSQQLLNALARLWATVQRSSLVQAACGKAFVGMDASLLQVVRAGERPSHVNTTSTAGGVDEQWIYEANQYHGTTVYIYVTNGRVTAVQE